MHLLNDMLESNDHVGVTLQLVTKTLRLMKVYIQFDPQT